MAVVQSFNRRRRNTIAGDLAGVIRLAFQSGDIASIWGLEGTLRASLRADLCLRGWQWAVADQAAKDIVAGAHRLLGAERPSWYEGQPEYIISSGDLIERTRCACCHKPLPDGRPKFCSDICRTAKNARQSRIREASDERAADMAVRHL